MDRVHCMSEEGRFNSVINASSFPMDINSKLVEMDNQGITTVPPWLLLHNKIIFKKEGRKGGREGGRKEFETIFLSCT